MKCKLDDHADGFYRLALTSVRVQRTLDENLEFRLLR
jgi:hypothetical protein